MKLPEPNKSVKELIDMWDQMKNTAFWLPKNKEEWDNVCMGVSVGATEKTITSLKEAHRLLFWLLSFLQSPRQDIPQKKLVEEWFEKNGFEKPIFISSK